MSHRFPSAAFAAVVAILGTQSAFAQRINIKLDQGAPGFAEFMADAKSQDDAVPVVPAAKEIQGVAIAAERLAELRKMAGSWRDTKAKARALYDRLAARHPEGSSDRLGMEAWSAQVWKLGGEIEKKQAELEAKLAAKLTEMAAAGTISKETAASRRAAVSQLTGARMLWIYGDLFPRIVEESLVDADGKSVGREWAGDAWFHAITEGEFMALSRAIIPETGFPGSELQVETGSK